MLEEFAKLLLLWPSYHFEGVNIFYYLLSEPEFSTSLPAHHHTTPRGRTRKKSPIHTDQPQTKPFRGTLKIHLSSSVPPSNTQHQIRHICKCDTEECISTRTGGERKSPFPFWRFHGHQSFPLVLKYCHAYNWKHTSFLNDIVKFWVNTRLLFGVFLMRWQCHLL